MRLPDLEHPIRLVGLTGSIGTGKSSAASAFKRLGVPVIDADEVLTDAQAALAAIKDIDEQRRYWAVSPNLILATPLVAPALGQQGDRLAGFNDEVKRWAARVEGATVLDPNGLLSTQGGDVDPQLFWPDGMTLTREGYQQLQSYFLKLAGS